MECKLIREAMMDVGLKQLAPDTKCWRTNILLRVAQKLDIPVYNDPKGVVLKDNTTGGYIPQAHAIVVDMRRNDGDSGKVISHELRHATFHKYTVMSLYKRPGVHHEYSYYRRKLEEEAGRVADEVVDEIRRAHHRFQDSGVKQDTEKLIRRPPYRKVFYMLGTTSKGSQRGSRNESPRSRE